MWEQIKKFQTLVGFAIYLAGGVATGWTYGRAVAQQAGREAAQAYVVEHQRQIVDELIGLNATVRALTNGQASTTCRAIGPQQIPGPDPESWDALPERQKVVWCEREKRYREALWAREDECKRQKVPREKCVMPKPGEVP